MVDFKTILELPDKDAITGLGVRKELNEVLYDPPKAWFAYLEDKAKLGCPGPMRSSVLRWPRLLVMCLSITGELRTRAMNQRRGARPVPGG